MFSPQALVLGSYFVILTCLSVYGVHRAYLVYLYTRYRRKVPASGSRKTGNELHLALPYVTVQLPIYNEMYVAERLISAVAAFDYPPARLEIQVLDDSTDETCQIAQRAVEHWGKARPGHPLSGTSPTNGLQGWSTGSRFATRER